MEQKTYIALNAFIEGDINSALLGDARAYKATQIKDASERLVIVKMTISNKPPLFTRFKSISNSMQFELVNLDDKVHFGGREQLRSEQIAGIAQQLHVVSKNPISQHLSRLHSILNHYTDITPATANIADRLSNGLLLLNEKFKDKTVLVIYHRDSKSAPALPVPMILDNGKLERVTNGLPSPTVFSPSGESLQVSELETLLSSKDVPSWLLEELKVVNDNSNQFVNAAPTLSNKLKH